MEMKLYVLIFAIKFNYVPNSKKAIWAYHLLNIHWAFKCLVLIIQQFLYAWKTRRNLLSQAMSQAMHVPVTHLGHWMMDKSCICHFVHV